MTAARFAVEFLCRAAERDYLSLDGSARAMVDKGIARLALRADEVGKPLSGPSPAAASSSSAPTASA